jgi:hypothetical protein
MKVRMQESQYVPRMDHNAMLPYLARAATEARKAKGRKQVHVAASLDRDQSTVARFEKAARKPLEAGWPIDADATVAAYADDLDISPLTIWGRALELWAKAQPEDEEGPPARLSDLPPSQGGPPSAQKHRAQRNGQGTPQPKSGKPKRKAG